ncbi:fimbria/pilus outer membrane usher protein [Sphingobium sp.]|uniref:fimbria/pilus outer membrane usher protein n=1 Tax=Sphingobium sp. TaxID=1912891 RepID=UPI0028BD687E|nr:fimbria/pilus outer membrane usher protein [Sphingobium sp.]
MASLAWSRAGPVSRTGMLSLAIALYSPAASQAGEAPDMSSLPSMEIGLAASWLPSMRPPLPVTVVLNGEATDEPCLVALRDGHLFVPSDAARSWGIRLPGNMSAITIDGQRFTALDGLAGLTARLDGNGAALLIDADPRLFPSVHLRRGPRSLPVARAVPAQFIGYDLSLSEWQGELSASAFLDAGLSGNWGVLGTTATVRSEGQNVVRLDSSFQRDFPGRRLRLILGDTLTRGGDWNRPVRFGGIRLGTDFSLTPDDITYPLPVLRGSAALPSTVELAAASSRQRLDVQPGNFTIDYQPVFTGSGEVTMTIRDAGGNVRNVMRSFYTSPRLLREGLDDFSLEAGFLRRNFGWSSFSYSAPFAAGSWRHGLSDTLTLFGRAEGSGDSQAAGLGLGLVIAPIGEISLAAAASHGKWGSGTLLRAQFQRITRTYAITASYQEESADFMQVGDDRPDAGKRSELAVAGSLVLGRIGNLSASHVENDQGDNQRFSTSSLSYAANLGPAYLSLGARRMRLSGSGNDGLFGSITLPLGPRASAGLFAGAGRTAASLNRSPPSDSGLGYRFLIGRDHDSGMTLAEGGLTWRTGAGDVELSAARHGKTDGIRLEARGALLTVGGEIVVAPRLDYAFALVDVLGDEEASLTFENRPVAQRAGGGRKAVITGLQPYAANRIAVDLDALPMDMLVTSPEQRIVPGYRQAVKVTFGSPPSHPATLWLVDENGVTLPVGLAVTVADEPPGVTGQGGEIYLSNARPGARIAVRGPEMACLAIVPALPQGVPVPRIGPVSCIALKKEDRK